MGGGSGGKKFHSTPFSYFGLAVPSLASLSICRSSGLRLRKAGIHFIARPRPNPPIPSDRMGDQMINIPVTAAVAVSGMAINAKTILAITTAMAQGDDFPEMVLAKNTDHDKNIQQMPASQILAPVRSAAVGVIFPRDVAINTNIRFANIITTIVVDAMAVSLSPEM